MLGENNLNYAEFTTIKVIIKPQGSKSKIIVPGSYVEDNRKAEFIAPTTSVSPEEIILGNINLGIYDEKTVSKYNDNKLLRVSEEEKADPNVMKI